MTEPGKFMKKNSTTPESVHNSPEHDITNQDTTNMEDTGTPRKGILRFLNVHVIFLCLVAIIISVIVVRIQNWGVMVDLDEIFKDGPGTYEDNLDSILPLIDENHNIIHQEDPLTIVAFGNSPFADDRDSEDNLANLIAEMTGATVYNCSISGSYLASQNTAAETNEVPMDVFCFYWLVHLLKGSPVEESYALAEAQLGDAYPPEAHEVLNTLTTLDFNEVDVITIMYDATDYLLGHGMYTDANSTDIQTFTGNLEAGIELLQKYYPHIRIIVMSPTYAYAVDKEGNYISSDQFVYNNRDVLSTYVIKEYASCASRSVSFVDHLYNTITEDNASEYLIDNLHLNVAGRRLVAERFEYFLNYYEKGYAETE